MAWLICFPLMTVNRQYSPVWETTAIVWCLFSSYCIMKRCPVWRHKWTQSSFSHLSWHEFWILQWLSSSFRNADFGISPFWPRCFERFIWPPYETTTDAVAYVHVTKRFPHGLPGHWRSWPVLYIWDGSSSSWRHHGSTRITGMEILISWLKKMILYSVSWCYCDLDPLKFLVNWDFGCFCLFLQSWPVKRSIKVFKWASVQTTYTSKVHILFFFTTYILTNSVQMGRIFCQKNKTDPLDQR